MVEAMSQGAARHRAGVAEPRREAARIPVLAFGMSLGVFLALTFVLCVLFDLWFPALAMNRVWAPLLPGFSWLSWGSFALGLVESFAYGWYAALVFGPLFNVFSREFGGYADENSG